MDTTEANDLQICLRKIRKLLYETCLSFLIKHPFVPLIFLSLFFLYMFFPLGFWVLVFSFPLFVCVFVITNGAYKVRRKEENNDIKLEQTKAKEEVVAVDGPSQNVKVKRSITRVHSVRRRRAKPTDFQTDSPSNTAAEEEKNTISSTNYNHETVEKSALPEEAPKEIREVEVTNHPATNNDTNNIPSLLPLQALKAQLIEDGHRLKCLEALRLDDKETKDDQNNVIMDVGIESNMRLESLIARRRSRRMPFHVRRPSITFMNMDKKDLLQATGSQLQSLIIPKQKIGLHFRKSSIGSLTPGSAPSVLVPLRNPFDIPYDPQEEKPDLTEDSFLQEFLPKGEPVYCRHESFNLGSAFSPSDMMDGEGGDALFGYETGFGRKNSSQRFRRFSRTASDLDIDFSRMIEEESDEKVHKAESETDMNNSDGDHIKEIIHKEEQDVQERERTSPVPEQDIATRSSSSRASTSDEEEDHVYKIDKEAILKSLSSMVRRHVIEEMPNKQDQPSNSQHIDEDDHKMAYSIASDMQVEVSDVGSPPAVNDESLSLAYNQGNVSSTLDEDNADDKKTTTNCNSGDSLRESRPSSPSQVMSQVNKNAADEEDQGISEMGKFEETTLLLNKESNDDNAEQSIHPHEEPTSLNAEKSDGGQDSVVSNLHSHEEPPSSNADKHDNAITDLHPHEEPPSSNADKHDNAIADLHPHEEPPSSNVEKYDKAQDNAVIDLHPHEEPPSLNAEKYDSAQDNAVTDLHPHEEPPSSNVEKYDSAQDNAVTDFHPHEEPPSSNAEKYDSAQHNAVTDLHPHEESLSSNAEKYDGAQDNAVTDLHPHEEPPSSNAEKYDSTQDNTVTDLHPHEEPPSSDAEKYDSAQNSVVTDLHSHEELRSSNAAQRDSAQDSVVTDLQPHEEQPSLNVEKGNSAQDSVVTDMQPHEEQPSSNVEKGNSAQDSVVTDMQPHEEQPSSNVEKGSNAQDSVVTDLQPHEEQPSSNVEKGNNAVMDLHPTIETEFQTQVSSSGALPEGSMANSPIPIQENEQQQS